MREHGRVDVQPLTTEIKTVEGQPVRLASRRAQGDAPTVLWLHGYPDNLQVFARAVRALPPEWGYVAADFPGQGRSARSHANTPSTSPTERARWLATLLDVTMLQRVRVFAHDMGAHAALELARTAPKRVERLVLCHSLLDGAAEVATPLRVMRASRAYRVVLPAVPGTVLRRCIDDFLPKSETLSWPVEVDLGKAFDRRVGQHTADVCDAAERWLSQGLSRYRDLKMPVVALWGTRNLYFPRVHADALAKAVPQTEVHIARDGWHWLVWHKPGDVIQALTG